MSDGYEGSHGGKCEGKVRKHHRKSTRTRSRQEKINRPKLNILNASNQNLFGQEVQYIKSLLKRNVLWTNIWTRYLFLLFLVIGV